VTAGVLAAVVAALVAGRDEGRHDAFASAAQTSPCGPPTRVARSPQPTLGPLSIPTFSATGRARTEYAAGRATKVPLLRVRAFSAPLVLRGLRCSDGTPLRFAYNGERLPPPPLTKEQLESAGSAAARLRAFPHRPAPGRFLTHTGYMLFSEIGMYRITAIRNRRPIGSLVVEVVPMAAGPTG
jgi:hypothetical protein